MELFDAEAGGQHDFDDAVSEAVLAEALERGVKAAMPETDAATLAGSSMPPPEHVGAPPDAAAALLSELVCKWRHNAQTAVTILAERGAAMVQRGIGEGDDFHKGYGFDLSLVQCDDSETPTCDTNTVITRLGLVRWASPAKRTGRFVKILNNGELQWVMALPQTLVDLS